MLSKVLIFFFLTNGFFLKLLLGNYLYIVGVIGALLVHGKLVL